MRKGYITPHKMRNAIDTLAFRMDALDDRPDIAEKLSSIYMLIPA